MPEGFESSPIYLIIRTAVINANRSPDTQLKF